MRQVMLGAKKSKSSSVIAANRSLAHMILNVHASTKFEDAKFRASMKPHIRKHYRSKNWTYFLRTMRMAHSPAGAVEAMRDRLQGGMKSIGALGSCGYWPQLVPDGDIDWEAMSRDEERFANKKWKLPHKHFTNDRERKVMADKAEDYRLKGIWRRVDRSLLTFPPICCFPIWQNGKWRVCSDFRPHNRLILVRDRMRLLGARTTIALLELALSKSSFALSGFQSKRDVLADVEVERRVLEGDFEEALERSQLCREPGSVQPVDTGGWDGHDEAAARACPEGGEDFSFAAHAAGLDLEGFYLQFAVDRPEQNVQAIADERGERSGPDSYSFFESVATQFGSLSSVYEDCAVSEAVQHTVLVLFAIVIISYIDDLTILARRRALCSCMNLVELHLQLIGLAQSHKKTCSHDTQRLIVLLGCAYEVSPDHKALTVSTPLAKIAEMRAKFVALKQLVVSRRVVLKSVNSAVGLFRHVSVFSPAVRGCAALLDAWTNEAFFWVNIKKKAGRARLSLTIDLLARQLDSIVPVAIREPLPEKHLYTDASLEEEQAGVGHEGVVDSGMHIGAALVERDKCVVFSVMIPRSALPDWLKDHVTIGILEIIANHCGNIVFDEALRGSSEISHVDNMADVFSIVKGSSRSPAEHAIVFEFRSWLSRACYWAWISTHRNIAADGTTRLSKFKKILELAERHFGKVEWVDAGPEIIPWDRYGARWAEFRALLDGGERRGGCAGEQPRKKRKKGNSSAEAHDR